MGGGALHFSPLNLPLNIILKHLCEHELAAVSLVHGINISGIKLFRISTLVRAGGGVITPNFKRRGKGTKFNNKKNPRKKGKLT